MIPKKIHYCWVGGGEKPESVLYCIESWKKYCPNYEIKEWNESNYDFTVNEYMQQAYEAKKWGFVPDYARLDIVYKEGGIYFDTDVELIDNIDHLLENDVFFGFENTDKDEFYINCGHGFGAESGHPVIKEMRDVYNNVRFVNEDNSLNMLPSPHYTTQVLVEHGLSRNNQDQNLDGITIYASDVLCPKNFMSGEIKKTSRTVSIHHFTASWLDEKIRNELLHNQRVYKKWGKDLGYRVLQIESVFEKYRAKELLKIVPMKAFSEIKQTIIRLLEDSRYTAGLFKAGLQKNGSEEIALLDTALESDNLGDQIIMENCIEQLSKVMDTKQLNHFPTHRFLSSEEKEKLKNTKLKILCGTNVLSGNVREYGLWKIDSDISPFTETLLMGAGFDNEDDKHDLYSVLFYKTILTKQYYHSVRDSFSERKLKKMGIQNVVYTGCPTMWEITDDICAAIPWEKGERVICTLTDYNRDPKNDRTLMEIIVESYQEVYFWPQGDEDLLYLDEIGLSDKVMILEKTLNAFDMILNKNKTDYIGTRLHAGIRAIRAGHRSIVITIDNRARCISNDTGLCTLEREDVNEKLKDLINSSFETRIRLPREGILKWMSQFQQ